MRNPPPTDLFLNEERRRLAACPACDEDVCGCAAWHPAFRGSVPSRQLGAPERRAALALLREAQDARERAVRNPFGLVCPVCHLPAERNPDNPRMLRCGADHEAVHPDMIEDGFTVFAGVRYFPDGTDERFGMAEEAR